MKDNCAHSQILKLILALKIHSYITIVCKIRLENRLKITHKNLGNFHLVSRYLTVLGSLALALHDTGKEREILKYLLTFAKSMFI